MSVVNACFAGMLCRGTAVENHTSLLLYHCNVVQLSNEAFCMIFNHCAAGVVNV